ncbi:glycosyltransferase family 2 protein [Streptomyces drozdowiczii]|uniref:Glycosyltransferase n=1 Tax=Streptomyces drozdowiczii TaxID=202862 RepID=A0ABY6Q0W9_9ACTN|nr:glycosyltransferase [Streptomyces drozdowiczii]MCX0241732.1 glycosyltransferase [Streptomyces drozdowiczii]UZK58046.1 glycosyltransferase [Streptomyces drozdowiczii]
MSEQLQCSVVIPTYNRKAHLAHTLDSLVRQTLPRERFEVLVVDDGSSDGTEELVGGYADRLDVRYFFQPDDGWQVARARNVGIAAARADVTVMIDSGVVLHSGALAAHLTAHRKAPGPVALVGYLYGFTVDNADAEALEREIDTDDPDATMAAFAGSGTRFDIREYFYEKYTDDFNGLPAPWVVFWTGHVSAPTAAIRAAGGFDENFRSWGGEDLDLGYRLHRDGVRFELCRDASAIHLPHYKDFEENEDAAAPNYQYMARKYGTPITGLLTELRTVTPFDFNDVIVERKLPACADHLAQHGVAG